MILHRIFNDLGNRSRIGRNGFFWSSPKFVASPRIGFVCRDTHNPHHRLGRVDLTPDAIWIQKMSGIAKDTRFEEIGKFELKPFPRSGIGMVARGGGAQFRRFVLWSGKAK